MNEQRSLPSSLTTTEMPLSKVPGATANGCPLLWVCVHGVCLCVCVCTCMGEMQRTISENGIPYLARCHITKDVADHCLFLIIPANKIKIARANKDSPNAPIDLQ